MTAKGAAQPNQPDETAPPSDGGAVSPGAGDTDAKAGKDAAAAEGSKTNAAAPNRDAAKRSGDGATNDTADGDAGEGTANGKAGGDTTIDLEVTMSQRDGAADKAGGKASKTAKPADSEAAKAAATAKESATDVDDDAGTTAADDAAVDAEATEDGATERAVDETDGQPLYAELETLRGDLGELTRDLQRVTAEYANYRKRVDRDRTLAAEQATGGVLTQLLPVLDDLDRARDHGDLVGPFGAVAEQLVNTLAKFGLTSFGEAGDPFDPTLHEAVSHASSPDVTETTCVQIMRRGYLLGDRLLRAALVGVADPQ